MRRNFYLASQVGVTIALFWLLFRGFDWVAFAVLLRRVPGWFYAVSLAVVLGAAYGANLTVGFYALIVLRQILAVEVLSPGWLSVRLLSWLCTIAAGIGSSTIFICLPFSRRNFLSSFRFSWRGS